MLSARPIFSPLICPVLPCAYPAYKMEGDDSRAWAPTFKSSFVFPCGGLESQLLQH